MLEQLADQVKEAKRRDQPSDCEDVSEERPNPDAISNEHLQALGKLTINFGTLEFVAAAAVWLLLEADNLITAQTVTAQLSFSARLDLLQSLAIQKLQGDVLLEAIRDFVSRARRAEEERNRIVHSHWWVDTNGQLLRVKWTARGRTGFQQQQEPVTPEDIATVFRLSSDAANALYPTLRELQKRFPIKGGQFSIG